MKTRFAVNIDTVLAVVKRNDGGIFNIPHTTTATLISEYGEILDSYQNRVPLLGKYDAYPLHARTKHSGKELIIEGSPFASKHGQNVYTSSNMQIGVINALKRVSNHFKFNPSQEQRQQWERGDICLERVDLAVNFRVESEVVARNVLRQIRRQLSERHGATRTFDTTVCLAPQNGKEYSISFYAKGPEMRRQPGRFRDLPGRDKLLKDCESILRVEVRLRASALRKHRLDKVSAWDDRSAEKVFSFYMRRLKFLTITSGIVTAEELLALPSRLRPVLAMHKAGVELSGIYEPRSLQRHRSDFRKRGIDLRCPNQLDGTVLQLTKVLSPGKVINSVPAWMSEAGLAPPALDFSSDNG